MKVILTRRGGVIGRPNMKIIPRVGDTVVSEFASDREYSHDFEVLAVTHRPGKDIEVEVE